MKRILFKEGIIFTSTVVLAALVFHSDLLTDPSGRIALMIERGNYLHPLAYGTILYLLTWIFRLIFISLRSLFSRFLAKNKNDE
jgi:hypothetical protein